MKQKLKIAMMGLLVALSPLVSVVNVSAWGPERPTYTNENPADHAVFNSITNNAAVGDERDFVRIVEKNTGGTYVSELEIEGGKQYEVYIYYHNDASGTYNSKAHDYIGLAGEVKLSSGFPKELDAGEREAVTGRITSASTNPASVWDEAWVTAKEKLTLHYVEGSAKIYNDWATNGNVLSTNLFSAEGTYLGTNDLNGVIPGCAEYSGHVLYTIQTYAVEESTPVVPDKPEPEIPEELPETGPIEVVFAIVLVVLIVAGIVYWLKTRKEVKKVTKRAKGRK